MPGYHSYLLFPCSFSNFRHWLSSWLPFGVTSTSLVSDPLGAVGSQDEEKDEDGDGDDNYEEYLPDDMTEDEYLRMINKQGKVS